MQFIALVLLTAVAGYLLGTLNGAILISRFLLKEDVRTHGSGNAGLTNFFRSYGSASTLLVLAIDVVKTVLAALLGGWLLGRTMGAPEFGKMLGGAFTVVGHMFPVFFQFRGGKGILCCAALAGVMDWRILAALLVVFILAVAATRYVSLGSCLGAVIYTPAFAYCFPGDRRILILALLLSLAALFMHRQNLRRLFAGTENRFSFHHDHKE